MKKLAIIAFSILLAVVFIAASTTEGNQNEYSLEGVWEMKHQYIYENNEILDTLYNLNGYRQVKIYSKGKVMWSRYNPTDTNEWFGYGTYEVKDGILEEQLEYASQAMMKIVDTVQVFRFELKLGKDTYSQISFDNDGNKYNSENYTRIE
ncbi:hypothetical protein KXJ69_02505 [Aureisphaera sp. CAU 1614]|uniref:Lipocalin-like domain-containing protein n=1 Tax=Halomarinibacterium sedimenti TaxID=2857106 RepID=A0A9X1FLR5_9FLAO|nr:hypothetical protein [Halomarinibacterium sedimenti]MBW2936958.1 hypothetical protein [Halomarinibacterium sedimenti]